MTRSVTASMWGSPSTTQALTVTSNPSTILLDHRRPTARPAERLGDGATDPSPVSSTRLVPRWPWRVGRLHHQRVRWPRRAPRAAAGSSSSQWRGPRHPVGGEGRCHHQLVGGGPGRDRREVAGEPECRCHLGHRHHRHVGAGGDHTRRPGGDGPARCWRDVEGVGQLGDARLALPGGVGVVIDRDDWRCHAPRPGDERRLVPAGPEHEQAWAARSSSVLARGW